MRDFDHDQMRELAYLKADRYARNGGGGTHTVYATAAAWDKAHGVQHMSKWRAMFREIEIGYRLRYQLALDLHREALHCLTLDTDEHGNVPF